MRKGMKHDIRITLAALLILPMHLAAQRRGIVVSADTRLPIGNVEIKWDNKEVEKTAWDGTFTIRGSFRRVSFFHPKCETRFLKPDEMTDTIYMLPASRMLTEVIIYGKRKRQPDYVGLNATDRQLAAAKTSGGADVLGLLSLVVQPILDKINHKKALKKAMKKQIIDNY